MMETLRSAVEGLVKKMPIVERQLKGYAAADAWQEEIDKKGKSWVQRFSGGILFVATESASFCQEVCFGKDKMIEELNKKAGEPVIKDIKIKVGTKSQREN